MTTRTNAGPDGPGLSEASRRNVRLERAGGLARRSRGDRQTRDSLLSRFAFPGRSFAPRVRADGREPILAGVSLTTAGGPADGYRTLRSRVPRQLR
jgi:hypothetical protein